MSYVMLATDGTSIAVMPIAAKAARDAETARAVTREWLRNYDHGFSHAIVVHSDVFRLMEKWTVAQLTDYVVTATKAEHVANLVG